MYIGADLAPLLAQPHPILVIDLSRVPACDVTGRLLLLHVAADVAAGHGGEVRLAAPPAPLCRALRQAGAMGAVATFRTVTGAVDADLLDLLTTPHPLPRAALVRRD